MAKRSGDYYISQAKANGLRVSNGKGDHFKVYGPNRTMMVIPKHLKGNGTECSIIKWFARLGIVVVFVLGLANFLF
jgi:hypothetical protein